MTLFSIFKFPVVHNGHQNLNKGVKPVRLKTTKLQYLELNPIRVFEVDQKQSTFKIELLTILPRYEYIDHLTLLACSVSKNRYRKNADCN